MKPGKFQSGGEFQKEALSSPWNSLLHLKPEVPEWFASNQGLTCLRWHPFQRRFLPDAEREDLFLPERFRAFKQQAESTYTSMATEPEDPHANLHGVQFTQNFN
jgi:hypothetical protein